MAQGFGPGYNGKVELVVSGPKATDPAFLKTVTTALETQPGVVASSINTTPIPDKHLAFVGFTPTTTPQDAKTTALVKHLRSSVLPPVVNGGSTHVYVYGITAIQVDFAKVLQAKMPIFFLAVIGLSFLLLMVAFRSIVIPADRCGDERARGRRLVRPDRRDLPVGLGHPSCSASARAARSSRSSR